MDTIPKGHQCYNNPAMARSIYDLGLSDRAINCLERDQIYYIGQLVTKTRTYLSGLPNLGRKTLSEISMRLYDLYSLELGVQCDRNLETRHDVKEFFAIGEHGVPLTAYYADVLVPLSVTTCMDDTTIINIIQGVCQTAFEKAATDEAINVVSRLSSALSSAPQKVEEIIPALAPISLPSCERREVRVPLTCAQYLTDIFSLLHPDLLTKVANDIGGATLYSTIRCELEAHLPKPV